MTIELMRSFFGWAAIINMGVLLWWFVFIWLARDWTYQMHSKFIPVTKEQFNATHYAGMMFFKLLVFIFFVIPYFVLLIID